MIWTTRGAALRLHRAQHASATNSSPAIFRGSAKWTASVAVLLLLSACSHGVPVCPDAAALTPQALAGDWEARVGAPDTADVVTWRVRLQPHPDYAGVRGELERGPVRAQLAGDVNDQGLLLLDESEDGRSISAVWEGEPVARQCGSRFQGQWRRAGDAYGLPFELTRLRPKP